MKYVVTGAAGFIGSNFIKLLNDHGCFDIIAVDDFKSKDIKWKNVSDLIVRDFVTCNQFQKHTNEFLATKDVKLIYLGAHTDTRFSDCREIFRNNFQYQKQIIRTALGTNTQVVYASSAATYGDGRFGTAGSSGLDVWTMDFLNHLPSQNMYAWSKNMFDKHASINGWLDHKHSLSGIKIFNCYGPRENHKEHMRSFVYKAHDEIIDSGIIHPWRRGTEEDDLYFARDFIYVEDVCKVIYWLITKAERPHGLWNVGTGVATRWNDAFLKVITSMERFGYSGKLGPEIPVPESFREGYQHYTRANNERLRSLGYNHKFKSISEGIELTLDYIMNNK